MDGPGRAREHEPAGRLACGHGSRKGVACLAGVSLERGVPADDIHDYILEADNVVWVDVQDPGPAEIAMLIDEFGLHPLALEDAARGLRRPKADEFKGYLLLVTYAAVTGADTKALQTAEVDLFIGRNYVVSIHRGHVPALEQAQTRWTRGGPMLREGVGFLVYAVLDAIIDSFAPFVGGWRMRSRRPRSLCSRTPTRKASTVCSGSNVTSPRCAACSIRCARSSRSFAPRSSLLPW